MQVEDDNTIPLHFLLPHPLHVIKLQVLVIENGGDLIQDCQDRDQVWRLQKLSAILQGKLQLAYSQPFILSFENQGPFVQNVGLVELTNYRFEFEMGFEKLWEFHEYIMVTVVDY